MNAMCSKLIRWSLILAVVVALTTDTVMACPMCKAALEEDTRLPHAYQTSILFMLSVPGMIFTTLGVGLVLLGRREAKALEGSELSDAGPSSAE